MVQFKGKDQFRVIIERKNQETFLTEVIVFFFEQLPTANQISESTKYMSISPTFFADILPR